MKRTRLFFESTAIVPERRSGIGHALLEMLRELDKEEYADKYEVVAFVPLREGAALKRYKFKNIVVKQLPFTHRVLSALSRVKYGLPLDIFLGRGVYFFPNYRNFNLMNSYSITFIYDVCFLIHPEFTQPKNLKYLQRNMHKWIGRSDMFVTSSHQSKHEIAERLHIASDKIAVVRLGVDPNFFYPRSNEEIRAVRDKYSLGEKYVLYLGNIEPRKNLAFMISAYSSSTNLKPYELFLVGGDGWLNEAVYKEIDRANQKGYKVFKNQKYIPDEDLPALMSGASAVVLPSHHEGFGLSAVQADACETPFVASDIPVMREIGHDSFYYFENDDKVSFEKAMMKAVRSSHRKKQLHYTWRQTILELEGVFEKRKK